ncbi:hypothetical protein [uncultured Brevundimonas sp.]|uniref:hypothetical protein n=1 Tax=uncultured Brevundimonas sp. TaxID=213418 RepID=UPI002632ADA8|nr:hypothetical protein [uncultured Brevundimonas sp.]
MSDFESYNDYVLSLTDSAKLRSSDLYQSVNTDIKIGHHDRLSSFLFTPNQTDHPEYDDAATVFLTAFNRLYAPNPLLGDELPLFYLGYHVLNPISMKRSEQGFLLTDQALYVQDDFSITRALSYARGYPLPSHNREIPLFLSGIMSQFKGWEGWAKLAQNTPDEAREQVIAFLTPAIEAIIQHHQRHGSQREYVPTAPSVQTLARQYSDLIDPENPGSNAKKLAKAIDKFKVPSDEAVSFASVATLFFGAPYGIVVTSKAVYSRDALEDVVRMPLGEMEPTSLRITGDEIASNLGQIFLPSTMDESCKPVVLELINQAIVAHTG